MTRRPLPLRLQQASNMVASGMSLGTAARIARLPANLIEEHMARSMAA